MQTREREGESERDWGGGGGCCMGIHCLYYSNCS